MAPNVIFRGFNFQKVDHSKLLNCTEMKTSMLSTLRLFLSRFFIVSLPFSIQLPERHNRKKEKFQKNLFRSNFYQKTNLKQVMGQNSWCCFVNFHVFFVWSFFTRKKGLEQVFSQITCIFTNKWFIAGDSLLERKEKTAPDRFEGFFTS